MFCWVVCSQGCSSCATTTGVCTTCKTGFTPDTNDRTRCVPTPPTSSTGVTCTDGQFLDTSSGACIACSSLCKTCTGPLSTQCVACGAGQFMGPAGRCVPVDGGGICQGTKLVANNAKGICDGTSHLPSTPLYPTNQPLALYQPAPPRAHPAPSLLSQSSPLRPK